MVQLLEINVVCSFGVPKFVLKFTTKDGLVFFQNYVRCTTLIITAWHLSPIVQLDGKKVGEDDQAWSYDYVNTC